MNRRDSSADSALQSTLASTVRLLCKDVEEFARAGGAQQSSAALADRVLHRARRLETIEPRFHSLPLVALIRKRLAKQLQSTASSSSAALPSDVSFSLAAVATGNQPPLELSEQLRAELEHAIAALTASLNEVAPPAFAAVSALEASSQSRQQLQQSCPRATAVDGLDALLVSRPRQNQRRISDFSVEEEAEDRDVLEDSLQGDSFDGGDDVGFGGRRHRGSVSDGMAETGDDGDSEDFETIDDGDEDDADSYDEENLAVDLQRASMASASAAASVRLPSSVSKTQSAAVASSTSSHSWLFRDRRRGSSNDGRAGGARNTSAYGASGSGGGGRGAGRNNSGGGRLHSSSMRSLHSSLSVATPNAGGTSQVLFSDDDDDADGDSVARTKHMVGF